MRAELDHTHDATTESWVPSAQDPETDFPIQNLPLGVFRHAGTGERPRIGVAIGAAVVDLRRLVAVGLLGDLDPVLHDALSSAELNHLMAHGPEASRALRHALHRILRADSPVARPPDDCLVRAADAELQLPAAIGDYTDFYASVHHASNVGALFRPDQPLLPNYKWVPIGYHGRASSVVPSGTPVRRPLGQLQTDPDPAPRFGPTRALDYECELGAWVGAGNPLGVPVPIAAAEAHLFGVSLLNDWSARDIQRWEYQPLGPFLSKNFATSVSPWVVTMEALAPFRAAAPPRPPGDPGPLPYLDDPADRAAGAMDIALTVELRSERMVREGMAPWRLSRGEFRQMYWTMAQLLAHHASNGCNLRPGDLLGSGTVSGPDPGNRGCLLELTRRGAEPVQLPTGESRRFLEDGDEVTLRGRCQRPGFRAIGFGTCSGRVVAA